VGDDVFPFVGFASKPWDFDSACIVITAASDKPEDAVRTCRQLGAPVVWVCRNGTVEWWTQHSTTPTLFDSRPLGQFDALVRQHKANLLPESIYRAKTLGRLPGAGQLSFVDVGLMPLLRGEEGEKLGGLVENMTRVTLDGLSRGNPGKTVIRDVFINIFRLLAGKILKDKDVGDFGRLDLQDPAAVLSSVARHYSATDVNVKLSRQWRAALLPASELISRYANVRVVSPETLAYVYEHTLVSKALRKTLGIHATPPYLVDYIVWQLYDWVREIPQEDRHVFEPACGHAPFLLAAMRMLRLEMQGETDRNIHAYLKTHIHGVEVDDFAREIARLSLTLADIPNPNGWDLKSADMYASNVLAEETSRCGIMLSNPPYERFDATERTKYQEAGFPVRHKKAVEMLDRTLRYLPPRAAFGVVVPQGVLHNTEAKEVRAMLLQEYEIREVCLFADKVFEEGEAETAVLLGRRRKNRRRSSDLVKYRRIREQSVERFAQTYEADTEHTLSIAQLAAAPDLSFRVPDLPEVWAYLRSNPTVGEVASVGQGFSFAEKGLIAEARKAGSHQLPDSVRAFLGGVRNVSIWEVPSAVWVSPSRTPINPWRSGQYTGRPQVLVNYVRVMRGPWRIKALLDNEGHAAINTYTTVRPITGGPPVEFIWAVLNSPLANAFVYCRTFQRHIYDSVIGQVPLPPHWQEDVAPIVAAAKEYVALVRDPIDFALKGDSEIAVREALLRMDAAVMKAYGMPVHLERSVLDLFRLPQTNKKSRRRKGVGCTFGDYFAPDFKSLIPLHKYISSAYRKSTVDEVAARMKPGESAHVRARLPHRHTDNLLLVRPLMPTA
jgi:type I restriction-modification system DNA methylase subunit